MILHRQGKLSLSMNVTLQDTRFLGVGDFRWRSIWDSEAQVIIFKPHAADREFSMQAALRSFEFQTEMVWIWYGIAFLLGCIALLMGVSVLGLTWISPAHARPSVAVVNQTIAAKRASRDHDKMRQNVERRELR